MEAALLRRQTPIARQIVENHKGKIEIQSDMGVGTRITMSLPHLSKRSKAY